MNKGIIVVLFFLCSMLAHAQNKQFSDDLSEEDIKTEHYYVVGPPDEYHTRILQAYIDSGDTSKRSEQSIFWSLFKSCMEYKFRHSFKYNEEKGGYTFYSRSGIARDLDLVIFDNSDKNSFTKTGEDKWHFKGQYELHYGFLNRWEIQAFEADIMIRRSDGRVLLRNMKKIDHPDNMKTGKSMFDFY